MPTGLYPWPDNPALSIAVWALFIVFALFGARTAAHRAIRSFARAVFRGCRLTARSIAGLSDRMAERNREVLLSDGLSSTEREIEQEFRRIAATVDRDLSSYPALHRKLADQVTRIEEDYRRSTDAPPEPQAWLSTMRAAEELSAQEKLQGSAGKAIQALHEGLREAHKEAVEEYRKVSADRHKLLTRIAPVWRHMDATLSRMDAALKSIFERANHIDVLVGRYVEIANKSARAEQTLGTSALTQFFIAGVVLLIASMGGFINFQLIALPMSEMVGATSRIAGMQTSDVAALVIILVEITMGIFLMESLRITRLFPIIGSMDERTRKRMAIATFSILFILAGIESSLAYMRDALAADRAALTQALAGDAAAARPEFMWIPAVGQMVMGFILPFALTFVAIPLESFVHSARVVGGQVAVGLLRSVAFLLRLAGNVARSTGEGLKDIYDMIIFLPLKVEEWVLELRKGDSHGERPKAERERHGPSTA